MPVGPHEQQEVTANVPTDCAKLRRLLDLPKTEFICCTSFCHDPKEECIPATVEFNGRDYRICCLLYWRIFGDD